MDNFRKHRNRLLADSDWTQSNDCVLSEEKKDEWKIYRQKLRDLPKTAKPLFKNKSSDAPDGWDFDVSSVTFPTKPS